MALSFEPDNFPLAGTLGYRSLSHEPSASAGTSQSPTRRRRGTDVPPNAELRGAKPIGEASLSNDVLGEEGG